jgi:CBS domain-containing protein
MFCSLIPFEGDNPMTLGDVCNRSVVVAERNETIAEAANRMRALHVGDLVVVESRGGGRVPIGILTDRDIVVSVVANDADRITSLVIGDVMSTDLVTAREHESTDSALEKMGQHGIRRLPIVDGDGNLIGIVTLDDLLEYLTERQESLVKLVAREQQREQRQRV